MKSEHLFIIRRVESLGKLFVHRIPFFLSVMPESSGSAPAGHTGNHQHGGGEVGLIADLFSISHIEVDGIVFFKYDGLVLCAHRHLTFEEVPAHR